MTTIAWIEAHATHGPNEHLRNGHETMMICPCSATHVYSVDTLIADQGVALKTASEAFESAREFGLSIQSLLDRMFAR